MKSISKEFFRNFSIITALAVLSAGVANAQNVIQFTKANLTPEQSIQLYWASNPSEVYEVDFATNLVADPNTGTVDWFTLYDGIPSQGTNTMVSDDGNYDIAPAILHPKYSPMRFYRVSPVAYVPSPTNPIVSIISPANNSSLSGVVTFQVSATTPEVMDEVDLYIDGEKQWSSIDDSNFVINTCEWPNGNHTIYATSKSESGLGGIPNGPTLTCGYGTTPYLNVSFNNLVSSFDLSEPLFQPALGQTQLVAAAFAANCNWTLQIQDVNSNAVKTVTGSGVSMSVNWDGTGTGETNIPDGVYSYYLSAATNGLPNPQITHTNPPPHGLPAPGAMEVQSYAVADGSESVVPLALYPPGIDTNGMTIFDATITEINSLTAIGSLFVAGVQAKYLPSGMASNQSTTGVGRKPRKGIKGTKGSFGICYKTYGTNGFSSPHPATGWPYPLPTAVAIDGQSRTAQTVDKTVPQFCYMANGFSEGMLGAGWFGKFIKADDQWNANDIKKTSLGGNSIFNTVNFGILMTHGSYGNSGTTGTEDDNVAYTYSWLGGNNFVRLSDMDFGSSGTNGLRWMTLIACNMLRADNYNSMFNAGKIPVNNDLHLLLGFSSIGYGASHIGRNYAFYLNRNDTIVTSFASALAAAYNESSKTVTNTVTIGVSGWGSCMSDTLLLYNDPDLTTVQYNQFTVFVPK